MLLLLARRNQTQCGAAVVDCRLHALVGTLAVLRATHRFKRPCIANDPTSRHDDACRGVLSPPGVLDATLHTHAIVLDCLVEFSLLAGRVSKAGEGTEHCFGLV